MKNSPRLPVLVACGALVVSLVAFATALPLQLGIVSGAKWTPTIPAPKTCPYRVASCNGGRFAKVTLGVKGGTPPYTWNVGSSPSTVGSTTTFPCQSVCVSVHDSGTVTLNKKAYINMVVPAPPTPSTSTSTKSN